MNNEFETLKLRTELTKNLKDLKFDSMTPIQAKSLPLILENKDVTAQAKTGSGKTAAFSLGILNQLNVKKNLIQALILCPTRELAEQVAKETRTLARQIKNIKVLTITGGQSFYHQEKSLSHGAHIVVGTPGRILKFLDKKLINFNGIDTLVLDEADRMLDMGFYDDIEKISLDLPKVRQTLLFSATFPEEIKELGERLQNNPTVVEVDVSLDNKSIEQVFIELESHKEKTAALFKVLSHYRPKRFIVFCKTKIISDKVADELAKEKIYAESIHGDLEQNERTAVLTMFSNESLSALVATDVAARGLDIQDLDMVINYDLPTDPEVYVHRIGRTARAGKSGIAVNLYMSKEETVVDQISIYQGIKTNSVNIEKLSTENKYDLVPPMTTIFISGGKRDKLRPGDIVGAIVGEVKIPATDIGDISITIINSFVAIKSEHVDLVIEKLNSGKIKNRSFKVGLL